MRRTPVIVLAFLCLSGAAAAADDLAPIMQLPQMLGDLKGAKADSAAAVAATQAAEADAAPLLKEHNTARRKNGTHFCLCQAVRGLPVLVQRNGLARVSLK
jgi:hypothetical protein